MLVSVTPYSMVSIMAAARHLSRHGWEFVNRRICLSFVAGHGFVYQGFPSLLAF